MNIDACVPYRSFALLCILFWQGTAVAIGIFCKRTNKSVLALSKHPRAKTRTPNMYLLRVFRLQIWVYWVHLPRLS